MSVNLDGVMLTLREAEERARREAEEGVRLGGVGVEGHLLLERHPLLLGEADQAHLVAGLVDLEHLVAVCAQHVTDARTPDRCSRDIVRARDHRELLCSVRASAGFAVPAQKRSPVRRS